MKLRIVTLSILPASGISLFMLQAQLPSPDKPRPTSQIFTPPLPSTWLLPIEKFVTQAPHELTYEEVAQILKQAEDISRLSLEELQALHDRNKDL